MKNLKIKKEGSESAPNSKFQIPNSTRNGYIALVSALIISAIIVLIVVTVGQTAFFGRAGIAGSFFKERSRALAQACANTALLKLSENDSYAGGETINIGSDTCEIFAIESVPEGRAVKTQGVFQRSHTNYKITIESDSVSIIGWEELKSF